MPITDLLSINREYVFKSLSVGSVSSSPYISFGFSSELSKKSIVVLYDCVGDVPVYQKEVSALSKSSLSPSKLIAEYNDLMSNWN